MIKGMAWEDIAVVGKDTTVDVSGDKVVVNQVQEVRDTIWYSKLITNKSKVLEMEIYDSNDTIKVKLK